MRRQGARLLSAAYLLGRVRASKPADLQHPPLDRGSGTSTPLDLTYAGYVVQVKSPEKGRKLLVLTVTNDPKREDRFLINTVRSAGGTTPAATRWWWGKSAGRRNSAPRPSCSSSMTRGAIGFAAMDHPGPWQFDCFYTSNISVPRQMLLQLDHVFDEDFKTYGWEDTELGYRLERNGMRLLYNAEAVADHDHPTDLVRFCRRQYQVGMCSRVFLAKHPELETHLEAPPDAAAGLAGQAVADSGTDGRLARHGASACRFPAAGTGPFWRRAMPGESSRGRKPRPHLCRSYQWRVSAANEWSPSEAEPPCENREIGETILIDNACEDRAETSEA